MSVPFHSLRLINAMKLGKIQLQSLERTRRSNSPPKDGCNAGSRCWVATPLSETGFDPPLLVERGGGGGKAGNQNFLPHLGRPLMQLPTINQYQMQKKYNNIKNCWPVTLKLRKGGPKNGKKVPKGNGSPKRSYVQQPQAMETHLTNMETWFRLLQPEKVIMGTLERKQGPMGTHVHVWQQCKRVSFF